MARSLLCVLFSLEYTAQEQWVWILLLTSKVVKLMSLTLNLLTRQRTVMIRKGKSDCVMPAHQRPWYFDGKRTPFYWVFLLLSGLRAEERPTFARHSQSPVAHLSTRHLLKGQGVPQLDHIQEKPGGEKQSLTNLLMCTCTCMWKGTFQEEVCLPFFI